MSAGRWINRVAVNADAVKKCDACGMKVAFVYTARGARPYNVFVVNGTHYRKQKGAGGGLHHCAAVRGPW